MDPTDVPYTSADYPKRATLTQSKIQNIIKTKWDDESSDDAEDDKQKNSSDEGKGAESEGESKTSTTLSFTQVELMNTIDSSREEVSRGVSEKINQARNRNKTIAGILKAARQPHMYSKWEKKEMKNYGSINYRNPRSEIYQDFIRTNRLNTSLLWKWFLFILIGVMVGLTAFTLKIVTEEINEAVKEQLYEFLRAKHLTEAYLWHLGVSLALICIGSPIVIWFEPNAAGGGIPEVIGYLNGVHVSNIFTPKVYIAKVISVICAVASGLPLGPEGPMIHIGGTIGAGVESSNPFLKKIVPWYHFRNQEDKRNFVLGGVAAGVSAAFNAPIGGLAFAWEEISTFWDGTTAWMILFGCMLSAFGTNLLLSLVTDHEHLGTFSRDTILFSVPAADYVYVWIFLPAIIIGVIGGILGVIFTFIALGIGKLRKKYYNYNPLKLVEPLLIVVLFSSIGFYFPYAFPCIPNPHYLNTTLESNLTEVTGHHEEVDIALWTCEEGYYNDMAKLSLNPGHHIIRELLKYDNNGYFQYTTLFAFLVYYFLFAAWCAGGIALSSGFVVPMITIGAIYGRIIGKVMLTFTLHNEFHNTPGLYALLGSAAFFAGVSRLSISLTIIMIELSGDVLLAFPLMVSIMVAKNLADSLIHPLYHEQLALKGVPYLDQPSHLEGLETLRASDVMTSTVVVIHEIENIKTIDEILTKYDFSSFPVVSNDMNYKGMIHRRELKVLLSQKDIFLKNYTDRPSKILSWYEFKMLSNEVVLTKGPVRLEQTDYSKFLDLGPYLNTGTYSISLDFNLRDAYELFRTLGLTHLMVINQKNQLAGVITRKDLVGENLIVKKEKQQQKGRLRSRIKDAFTRSRVLD